MGHATPPDLTPLSPLSEAERGEPNADFRTPLLNPFIAAAFLLLLCAALFLRETGSRALWASHEARAAQNAQRMHDDDSWLLPRLFDDTVELQKPPGFYWLVAACGKLLGRVNSWAVRLPPALLGTLLVFLVWHHLRRRGEATAGFLAACMLATAFHFTGTARIGRIDVPLACVVGGCMLLARDGLTWWRAVALGSLGAIALLLKGPIGLLLPVAALGVWWSVERTLWKNAWRGCVALMLAVGLAAPWYVWANHATDGAFFRTFFWYHHVNRAFGGAEALAGHPWWYYGPRFLADFLPWSPLLLCFRRRWLRSADVRFGLVWFGVMFVGLSCSRFKRADYLLPAYAGMAIVLGSGLASWQPSRRRDIAFLSVMCLVPFGWLAFDRLVTDREEAQRDQRPFAAVVREHAGNEPVGLFQLEAHLLTLYTGRPIVTITDYDTLSHLEIRWLVLREDSISEFRKQFKQPFVVVADSMAGNPYLQRKLLLLCITN